MVVVLFLLIVKLLQDANCLSSTTLSQRERISILRHEIKKEIRHVAGNDDVPQEDTSQEEQDYIESQNLPITPIMDFEKENDKKKSGLISTTEKMLSNNVNVKLDSDGHTVQNSSGLRSKNDSKLGKIKKNRIRKPLEIFYRRNYNKDLIHKPLEWIHCQDMVTPFLTGAKKDVYNAKRLSTQDITVQRVLHLLQINTTAYGRNDIYSILFQFSNLKLRLFQWDLGPINMLLNVIIKDNKHSFRNLKAGIREIFREWRMDISNTTNLLKQTRIFRPPCIEISKTEGSTKAQKNTIYTKEPTTMCSSDDEDCND